MASLFKEYKNITKKYGSTSNIQSTSINFFPKFYTKSTIGSQRKYNFQRNKDKEIDYFNQENINETEKIKLNQYFTYFSKGDNSSKFQSFNSNEDSKNNNLASKLYNHNSNLKRYYNYYLTSNLLKRNKYISDIVSGENNQQKMEETDDKIDGMIKYLRIYHNLNKNKINKMSNSMSQRYTIDCDKKDKNNTIIINKNTTQETNNIKTINKKDTTNLLSQDAKHLKDLYLYKKIFFYSDKKKSVRSDKGLDNKLNIIYSENEKQYLKNISKLNAIYKKLGKKKIYNIELSQSEKKVNALRKKVDFLKRVVDYTYPDMFLTKIKEQDKTQIVKKDIPLSIITSKINRKHYNERKNEIAQGLGKSIKIKKFVFKNANKQKVMKDNNI